MCSIPRGIKLGDLEVHKRLDLLLVCLLDIREVLDDVLFGEKVFLLDRKAVVSHDIIVESRIIR